MNPGEQEVNGHVHFFWHQPISFLWTVCGSYSVLFLPFDLAKDWLDVISLVRNVLRISSYVIHKPMGMTHICSSLIKRTFQRGQRGRSLLGTGGMSASLTPFPPYQPSYSWILNKWTNTFKTHRAWRLKANLLWQRCTFLKNKNASHLQIYQLVLYCFWKSSGQLWIFEQSQCEMFISVISRMYL